jgi:hypothetical protein
MILHENKFKFHNVYKADKTGLHNDDAPNRERSELHDIQRNRSVANTAGKHVPLIFVVLRKAFHDHFLQGRPVSCKRAGNGSSWM